LRARNGAVTGVHPVGDRPFGVVFDGNSIWMANNLDNTVVKITRTAPSDTQ